MTRLMKKRLMLLLKGVFVIALFSVIVINMAPVKAEKDYSSFDFSQVEEKNKEKWMEYCKGAYAEQGQKGEEECYKTLSASLKKFYEKLYKILGQYQAKELYVEDQVILWTVFFSQLATPSTGQENFHVNNNNDHSYSYDKFDSGYYGFELDQSDDAQVEIDYKKVDYYAHETDTIKTLVRNAIAYATTCYGVVGPPTYITAQDGSSKATCPNGGSPNDKIVGSTGTVCADKVEYNELGFWKFFTSRIEHDTSLGIINRIVKFLGLTFGDENYDRCMGYSGYQRMSYQYEEDPYVSYDKYFDFLRDNAYFDGKSNLQFYYEDILNVAKVDCIMNSVCENSLEAKGEEEFAKYDERLKTDRLNIIYDLLEYLDEFAGVGIAYGSYTPKSNLIYGQGMADRKAYYWPIGSSETEDKNGVVYAVGEPTSTTVKSYFGNRTNEVTNQAETHYGIDIAGEDGKTNVIAMEKGNVIEIKSDCSVGDHDCNEGYGNAIVIQQFDGNYAIYGLLKSIDSSVTVGSTVQKGQVIGLVGKTGRTNSAALHVEIRENSNTVEGAIDPLDLIKPGNPRPSGISGGDFSMRTTNLTSEEFQTGLKGYCNSHKCSQGLQYFAANAQTIYNTSVQNGLNPEFTVARAMAEGFSPHFNPGYKNNNHWGINCTNSGGGKDCLSYSSLEDGIRGLANLGIVKKYESALEVFTKGHYAYIGNSWIEGSSSAGGCYYFPYIKEYYSNQSRVAEVEKACSLHCTSNCMKTNDEDQEAYGYYQIRSMTKARSDIWGL